MKKTIMGALAVTLIFLACNSNSDQQADRAEVTEDSVLVDDQEATLPEQDVAIINETGFSKYARQSMPQLNWGKFSITKFWKEDFNHKTAFEPEANFFDVYGQFLKYSPDSSKFIDLDSYNVSITKNGKGKLVGNSQGPETEITLVDLKSKEKTQLLYLGPGNSVEDAAWIDNNTLILIGYLEDDASDGVNAAIWQIDLTGKNVNLYELSDPAVLKTLKNYTERERLKNVIIK